MEGKEGETEPRGGANFRDRKGGDTDVREQAGSTGHWNASGHCPEHKAVLHTHSFSHSTNTELTRAVETNKVPALSGAATQGDREKLAKASPGKAQASWDPGTGAAYTAWEGYRPEQRSEG